MFTTAVGCDSSDGRATARIITHRSQLIGGHRAAGELGDVLIENEKVRFIVHKAGLSRGFGVYGGSIIDADLRRPHEQPDGGDGQGFDNFSEMFPAFFLQAVAVDEVNIISEGSDGGAAIVEYEFEVATMSIDAAKASGDHACPSTDVLCCLLARSQ